MPTFRKGMTIKKSFLLMIFLLLVATLGGGATIVSKNMHILSGSQHIEMQTIPILNRAHNLKLSVVQVQQWLTDISATRARDGLNDGFDEAENNAKKFKQLITELKNLDPENSKKYDAMLPIFDAYYNDGKRMAQAYIDQGPTGGNKIMAEFDESAATMSETVDVFLQEVQTHADSALVTLDHSASSVIYTATTVFVIVLIVVIGLYLVMSRTVSALTKLSTNMSHLANGDLTTSLNLEQKDELGEVAQHAEQMRIKLKEIISQINETSSELKIGAESLTVITDQTNNNLQTQQTDIEQIATAINQMTATITEVANNTNQAALASDEVTRREAEGITSLENNLTSIQELIIAVDKTNEDVRILQEKSTEIDAVLTVIRDITDQTNLLALNAAIEAARAGEAGRGFAVVADEVRGLAQRTQNSASDIQTMISAIQESAISVNSNISTSAEKAESTGAISEKTREVFDEITAAISEIDNMITQISTASEEQAHVSEDVNQKIININEVSQQTATGADKLFESSQNIATYADKLNELSKQFSV